MTITYKYLQYLIGRRGACWYCRYNAALIHHIEVVFPNKWSLYKDKSAFFPVLVFCKQIYIGVVYFKMAIGKSLQT